MPTPSSPPQLELSFLQPTMAQSNHERGSLERGRQRQTRNDGHETHQEKRKRKALKNHMIAASGEFVGTTMFLWFAFAGTQVAGMANPGETPDAQRLLYISLSFGMSLLVVVWAFYRISGGLFNPAVGQDRSRYWREFAHTYQVTLGLCLAGAVPWFRGLCLLPAQLLAGIVAAGLASCMFPGPIALWQTRLGAQTSIAQGIFTRGPHKLRRSR